MFIAIYVIEASVPTIIVFCVKSAKMLMIHINGRRFGPVAFISAKFRMRIDIFASEYLPHAKSGADEGYWAEMSLIYINHRHLRGFYTKESYCGNTRHDHINSYKL